MTNTTRPRTRNAVRRALASLALLAALALPGQAPAAGTTGPAPAAGATSLPGRVSCTTEPRSRWVSEDDIRRIFGVENYVQVKFKVSRNNCYEFYAVGREGGVVEAYYHPITGRLVKESRFGTDSRPRQ